jgi:phosphoribosylformylglycinamidine synthase
MEMKVAAIGWKDSASGSDKGLDVPPTIVTFANTPVDSEKIVSAEFKKPWNSVALFKIKKDKNWLPEWEKYKRNLQIIQKLIKHWHILSSSIVDGWWLITAISKLTLGNKVGFEFDNFDKTVFQASLWDIIVEFNHSAPTWTFGWYIIWKTSSEANIKFWKWEKNKISLSETQSILEWTLENVWSTKRSKRRIEKIKSYNKRNNLPFSKGVPEARGGGIIKKVNSILQPQPIALIPVFPGTNSELDTKHSLLKAGFRVEEFVFNTLSPENFIQSRQGFAEVLSRTNLLVFPGGFSLGDEPEGSAKFIVNIMKSPEIRDSFQAYLDRKDSLTLGICNGFQALIKLWVFEDGNIKNELRKTDETLTYNESLRHETDMVRLKVSSILSPFLSEIDLWSEYIIPISHSEWKIIISQQKFIQYEKNWQIPLQYRDEEGRPTNKYNGSAYGVAALSDPSGRILGMMPHPEREWLNVFKNIPWEKYFPIFKGAWRSLKKID